MKRIGYVAQNLTLGTSASRTVRVRNVTDQKLRELISENLASLKEIIEWNARHGIHLYRITSNLIPYASHESNRLLWWEEYVDVFRQIGGLIAESEMVVSMHPGQYTLLSSLDEGTTARALAEIEYHSRVIDELGLDTKTNIVLHLGGAYGDKPSAIERWVRNYRRLSPRAAERIVLENDDRLYTVDDCLVANKETGSPIVFDRLHYDLNPGAYSEYREALEAALSTWPTGRTPEIHYSNAADGRRGRHSETIDLRQFLQFWEETADLDFDIMLETKDKEQSVLKIFKALGIEAA